jgi:hypothetical protein
MFSLSTRLQIRRTQTNVTADGIINSITAAMNIVFIAAVIVFVRLGSLSGHSEWKVMRPYIEIAEKAKEDAT